MRSMPTRLICRPMWPSGLPAPGAHSGHGRGRFLPMLLTPPVPPLPPLPPSLPPDAPAAPPGCLADLWTAEFTDAMQVDATGDWQPLPTPMVIDFLTTHASSSQVAVKVAADLSRVQHSLPSTNIAFRIVLSCPWYKAAPVCTDLDGGATDTYNDGCSEYTDNPLWCDGYDDDDFTSSTMCCACGGGARPSPSPPPDGVPPRTAPETAK